MDEKVRSAVKNYQQAADKVAGYQKQAGDARTAATAAETEAHQARNAADDLAQVASQNKKDPNNPKQAPKTVEARRVQREKELLAEQKTKRAEEALEQLKLAENNVIEAEQTLQRIYSERSGAATTSVLPYLLGTTSVIVCLGAATFLLFSKVRLVQSEVFSHLDEVRRRQDDISSSIKALPGIVNPTLTSFKKEVDSHFKSQREQIRVLGQKVEANKDGSHRREKMVEEPSSGYYLETIGDRDIGDFPITAREYLSKFGSNATAVKDDPLHEGILLNDPDGEFVLVRDSDVRSGLIYAIPKVPYFRSQEYQTYYDKYYSCQKPSPGEVIIVEPATVDKVEGGWRLRDRGVLEVNKS